MANVRGETFEKEKGQFDTTSRESPIDQESAVLADPDALQYGDTQNDLVDMQRLGKKQEFKVSSSMQAIIMQC
jgi:hypothetical protein